MSRLRSDSTSIGFGRTPLQALALAGLLGMAGVSGLVQAWLGQAAPAEAEDVVLPAVATSPLTERAAPTIEPMAVVRAPAFSPVSPAAAALDESSLAAAEAIVRAEVERGAFPGAALAMGRGAAPVALTGIGRASWTGRPVDAQRTVYDVASLTKVVGTTTAVMLLVEDGRMELDAPVARYLPGFGGGAKDRVTVRHLLTHTSGLPAWADLWAVSPEASLRKAIGTELQREPGERTEYSDIGFVVLYAAAEAAAGEPLPKLLRRRVFAPLGMRDTGYLPGEDCTRCAPTLRTSEGKDVRGRVHDPIARHLGGVAGNAGLFSTAADLARFSAMLANGGELDGVRVLKEETVRLFAQRQPGARNRALGWESPDPSGGGAAGQRIASTAFGHTGYTGTSLWVDPERGTWTVLLTNRTYEPRAPNRIQEVRRSVHDRVAAAADLGAARMAE